MAGERPTCERVSLGSDAEAVTREPVTWGSPARQRWVPGNPKAGWDPHTLQTAVDFQGGVGVGSGAVTMFVTQERIPNAG